MPSGLTRNLFIALVLSVLIASMSDQRPFEEVARRAAAAEETSKAGSRCPLSREEVDKANLGLLSICIKYGLGAYEAAKRYPSVAPNVFAVYGDEEEFQAILDRYGHQVIPVIAYFVENSPTDAQLRYNLSDGLHKIWAGERPIWQKMTPEQMGLIAIRQIASNGHEMLAEFEIVDGNARRKLVTTAVLETKQFLIGNISDVEKVLVRGERLPTWEEAGFAVLDAAIVAAGVGTFAKAASAGELAEKSAARTFVETTYKTVRWAGSTSTHVAPILLAYFVITKPQLIVAFGGWMAEQLGFSPFVGKAVVCFIGVLFALMLFGPFIRCLFAFGRWRSRIQVTFAPPV